MNSLRTVETGRAAVDGEVPVSVILPTRDRAPLLPRSIGSVLVQSFGDFELIVIDDGSDDDTADVVRGLADSRVRYLSLGGRHGPSAARNAGLSVARGTFLAFQDSDDEWHPEKLERQLRLLAARPEAAVVYGDMHRQTADGRRVYLRSPEVVRGRLVNPETRFWQTYMLAMQPSLVRRAHSRGMWFDERLELFEDLDFHLRLALEHEYVHIDEPLVTYHETQGLTAGGLRERVARRELLHKYRRVLVAENPRFLLCETVNALLGRSLMPLVRRHLIPS